MKTKTLRKTVNHPMFPENPPKESYEASIVKDLRARKKRERVNRANGRRANKKSK